MVGPSDRLVRLAVLGGALLAVIAFTVAFAVSSSPKVDLQDRQYVGARILPPGPGPDGLPLIPVRVENGFLVGLPIHLEWYSYCRPDMPGLDARYPTTNRFVFNLSPEKLQAAEAQGMEIWYEGLLGNATRASDFTELWQGAAVSWRSEGLEGYDQMRAIVFKVDPTIYSKEIRDEYAPDGFLAVNADSTHHCCITGWRENNSPVAKNRDDGFDVVYDPCHDSRYDIREIRSYETPPGDESTRIG